MKLKKFFSLVLALTVVLSCFAGLSVTAYAAAADFQIYVSSDGVDYEAVDMSKFTATDWIMNKNDGYTYGKWYADSYGDIDELVAYPMTGATQFAYVYFEKPEGSVMDIFTGFCMDGGITPLEPWREDPFENNNTYFRTKLHHVLPVKAAASGTKNDPIVIPLRMGRPAIVFNYKEDADATKEIYGMRLLSGWATSAMSAELTNLHRMFYIWGREDFDTIGMPQIYNGASLGNDNQTILDTYQYARPNGVKKEWNEKTLWVGAHFSKWLEGSSYVAMPIWGMTYAPEKNAEAMADPNTKFFDIQTQEDYSWTANYSGKQDTSWTESGAGLDGEVVVLMASPAAEGSKYLDPSSGWECVNNGTSANGISTKNADFSARDKNSYTNTDYYATAIQWKASSIISSKSGNSVTDYDDFLETDNAKRTVTTGIRGSIDGAWNKASKLTYAYRYKFKAGDAVPIWNPCNITDSEEDSMMVPIIKYYTPEEKLTVSEPGALYQSQDKKLSLIISTTLENKQRYTDLTAYYVVYDKDGRLAAIEKQDAMTAVEDEFEFDCATDVVGGTLKVYMWDDDMKPYEVVDGEYKLDDIMEVE